MPQSLNLTLVHLVFSTKDRAPFLSPDVQPDLHAYLATVARHGDGECYRAGGVADHVHFAIRLSRTLSIADLVSELKTSSSKWLKERSPALSKFSWQRGYASFSIGPRDFDAVISYIEKQEEHHRTKTFQDEYRNFLRQYGIEFDERYVWDESGRWTGSASAPCSSARTTSTGLIAAAPPFTASPISIHSMKSDRDIEKTYPVEDFIAKLRRLADCLESGEQFEIQIAGERIYVPVRAVYSIEHEREDGAQEIEFQIKWDT